MQSDTPGAELVADDEWLPLNALLPYVEMSKYRNSLLTPGSTKEQHFAICLFF